MLACMHFDFVEINARGPPTMNMAQRYSPHWTNSIIKLYVFLVFMVALNFPFFKVYVYVVFMLNSEYIDEVKDLDQ